MVDDPSASDRNVEIWKMKKFSKSLEVAGGNGTSMISLIIPPKDQISRVSKMLADEFGSASNIKSQVNCLSVLGAITSVQQRLRLYNKNPGELVLTIVSLTASQYLTTFSGDICGNIKKLIDFF
uniref:Eukaryotic peptide chain release factor subunit 1 n=1 Tax=Colobus angolensis palliatus TaxID=336983 RepID=A0A2K5KFX1_COLAP